jgi:hypothetical protein
VTGATLTIGASFEAVGLLLSPIVTADSGVVMTSWSHHWEAPDSSMETHFKFSGQPPMLLRPRNTLVAADAVVAENSRLREVSAVSKRIAHLRKLTDGWVGSGSFAPNPIVLSWLETRSELIGQVPGVSIIPMEDGSVAVRWAAQGVDFTAEVRANMTLYTFVDDLGSDDIVENLEPLTDEALERFLANHSPA